MRISELRIEELKIPFKVSFQHSTASRKETEAVLVKTRSEKGSVGLGEGCPRDYVTAESVVTAMAFFNSYHDDLSQIRSLEDLKAFIEDQAASIDRNPAAFCAIEMSLLNTLAAEGETTVEQLLNLPALVGKFNYTAVLGVKDNDSFASQLQQYQGVGFKDFKVKLFGVESLDALNIATLKKRLVSGERIRFDANNLWQDSTTAIEYLANIDVSWFAVEEAIAARQYDELRLIHKFLGKRVILDESFLQVQDFDFLQGEISPWVINLRVSKMGGIIRSLAIAERALELNIPLIIGAQVGETSLLTRAALTIANAYRENVIAQEGAFGLHLLLEDVVSPPISFGKGGVVEF